MLSIAGPSRTLTSHKAATAFDARFAYELAWLRGVAGLSPFATASLGARIAASQPCAVRQARVSDTLPAALLAGAPDVAALSVALHELGLAPAEPPADADIDDLARLWPFALAVETLLASGGDDRLALDPQTGLNRYLCAPWPRPDVIGFASCTASSLSAAQFAAAESARRALLCAALANGPDRALKAASAEASRRILAHFGVADLADAVLAASGTDAALIVTGVLAAEQPDCPITSLLMSPAETGSGVPEAVQGRHFAGFAPTGHAVPKGGLLAGLQSTPRLVSLALRHGDGTLIPPAEIARACSAAIAAALPAGRVVLHAIDGSKTGLTAPDRPTLMHLARRFGGSLDIVIDACQARIEPALVRWYLQQGFPVLVTGSKFFAAPGFCGAVLFPRARLGRIAAGGRVAGGLAAYASVDGGVGSRHCAGLLLRWTAALHDMDAFGRLPADEVGARLDRLGQSVRAALRQDSRLAMVAASRPPGMGWSDRSSVFTFTLRGQHGWMDAASLRPVYLALNDDSFGAPVAAQCQIGQPVQLGSPTLGGLRLALSAAQVTSGNDIRAPLEAVVGKLRFLLDRDGVGAAARSVFAVG